MIWTAVLRRNGQTSAISFNSDPSANAALKDISQVTECDGYEILALLKGNQCHSFYGLDENKKLLVNYG